MVNPLKTIIKNFSKTELYRKEMLEVIQSVIKNESMLISKQDSDLFKAHASNNDRLMRFDWDSTGLKLKCRAPYLYSFYSSAVCLNPKKKCTLHVVRRVWFTLLEISENVTAAAYCCLNS
jgi:hypothetical protein